MGVNRQKSRKAKLGRFWCGACDMAYLGKGQRCPVCGNREKKVNKK